MPDTEHTFDVFGRIVIVRSSVDGWIVFYGSTDGKRRVAEDIRIPSNIATEQLGQFLADLCHEWATPEHGEVTRSGAR